ncbi:MAG: hypothetical protein JWM68_2523 [Verrucomicrobiales bacterium]|nr:hypothetical protein [Verrucomicrobiales bacterium]
MSAPFNDGAIPYGSRILSITNANMGTPAAVDAIAENISLTRPSTAIERKGILDEPTGAVIVAGFVTGSATLQLATSASIPPNLGATFMSTFDSVTGSESFYVSEVGIPETQGDAKKVTISFRKKYN